MKADRLRGHLDALVLAVLDDGPRHGYAIAEALSARSGGAVSMPTGTLYPALRRLERAGYLRSEWATVAGRQRRTYWITDAGSRFLAAERADWRDFSAVIEGVLGTG
ncbi:PadR family transcriptional regulator [Actinocatenispora thailandica]|jgi:DNA-binding PadR family transcriptional regulator|uniref:PadR family transcriptional regulator n=1 Tax=Actinocatenispora thailandica TaxID=227318 RepID=A0A7R7HWC3_9ACTN|nr:helix-turn-helix transcriptional regulator [Actinocatenispora thailandica]BCJ34596.1 PadR family transcriptional regulator [Actinocatenispora thailandica]